MIEYLLGAATVYAIGVAQVYRERREYSKRNRDADHGQIADLRIALRWPLVIGPQY